jgi:hypothetical protein
VAGITLLVDVVAAPGVIVFVQSDARGIATWALPIAADPALAGLPLFAQVAWVDACGPQGLSASRGLGLIVQP